MVMFKYHLLSIPKIMTLLNYPILQVRLGQLFAVRPRFLEHELVPYFLDMVGGVGKPKSIAELLLSHTRVVDDFYIPK